MPISKSSKYLTLLDLMKSTKSHFPEFADRADACDYRSIDRFWSSSSTFSIEATVYSMGRTSTSGGKIYKTVLVFHSLGKDDYGTPLVNLPVKVSCSCSSYYFWFIYANAKAGANVGGMNFKKYVRKTPVTDPRYPEKNPHNYPGLCKHLYFLADQIRSAKLVLPSRTSKE